jgi:16S rRNA processing protein RimM
MEHEKILIGKFGAPHGIKGAISIHSWTDPPDKIFSYHLWYICQDDTWKTLKTSLSSRGKKLIATLEKVQDRDTAQTYTNTDIYIDKNQLPKLSSGQYYWSELAGLKVMTSCKSNLGKVAYVFNTGANDILAVQGERERLLPFISDTIVNVDMLNKTILVNWDPDF